MKFLIYLDQKAALAAGVDCPNSTTTIDIDPAQIPECLRAVIAQHYDVASGGVGGPLAGTRLIPPVTAEGVIAAWDQRHRASEADRQERLAKFGADLAAWAAQPLADRVQRNWYAGEPSVHTPTALPWPDAYNLGMDAAAIALYDAARTSPAMREAEAECARRNTASKAREAADAEARAAREAATKADQERRRAAIRAWLVTHCTPERVAQYDAGHLRSGWVDDVMEAHAWSEMGAPPSANVEGIDLTDITTVPPAVWDRWMALAAQLPQGVRVAFEKGVPEHDDYDDYDGDTPEPTYYAYVQMDLDDRIELPRITRRFAL